MNEELVLSGYNRTVLSVTEPVFGMSVHAGGSVKTQGIILRATTETDRVLMMIFRQPNRQVQPVS